MSDGEWKSLFTEKDNNEMIVRYSFCGVTSQKVRIDITDPGVDNYARLYEIEVFDDTGKNVAASSNGGSIEADSYVSDKRKPSYAIDGYNTPETGYWSPKNVPGPHYLMVDFGEEKEFNEIKIVETDDSIDGKEAGFVDYQIQYNKGTTADPEWIDLANVKNNVRSSAFAAFDTIKAQQVRFYVTKTLKNDCMKIVGFRVYNRNVSDENLVKNAKITASSENKALGSLTRFATGEKEAQNISCITAFDLSGNILWQKGTPDASNRTIGADLPIQIYDIDNDGEEEIIIVYNDRLQILSHDGSIEKEVSLYLQADCLMPADVRGLGTRQDIIVKDRYKEIAVYNNDLELLWSRYENQGYNGQSELYGHFPYPYDIDFDGKDEIFVGNITLDDDGTVLERYITDGLIGNTNNKEIIQHSDGMKMADLDPSREGFEKVSAHSSAGILFIDAQSNRYKTDVGVGHAQKNAVGEFAPNVPGLEVYTTTKASITAYPQLYLHSGNGERLWENGFDFKAQSGVIQIDSSSFIMAGSGQEYLLIGKEKKLIDNENNSIVDLTGSVPSRFGYSVNIAGDEREELLMWNEGRVQIWTNTAPIPDGGKNLAKSASITADSTFDENYSVSALNDGSRSSVWKSADTVGDHWITVDFGEVKTFDELWIYGYKNDNETYFPKDFKIQYNLGSVANPSWMTIQDVKNNLKERTALTFAPVKAQQVRIVITNPTTALANRDNAARICEIEIYEALPESFTPVTSENVNTGNTFTAGFNGSKKIDGALIEFNGEVRDFKLQYNTGTPLSPVWQDISSVLCNGEGTRKFAFTPVETDSIRVVVTKGSGSISGVYLREYSGYDYLQINNELIVNPTKSGNMGSYRWTNY